MVFGLRSRVPTDVVERTGKAGEQVMTVEIDSWLNAELCGGRYSVQSFLGEGGMARVYRAFDQSLQSAVVIKVPREAMLCDPEFAARFRREMRAVLNVNRNLRAGVCRGRLRLV